LRVDSTLKLKLVDPREGSHVRKEIIVLEQLVRLDVFASKVSEMIESRQGMQPEAVTNQLNKGTEPQHQMERE